LNQFIAAAITCVLPPRFGSSVFQTSNFTPWASGSVRP
jgi:hypothetical protein